MVFLLYWFFAKNNLKVQNFILLSASYFFYACWDWRFLFLLIFSTLLDFWIGGKIQSTFTHQGKRNWVFLSLTINLGILFAFKYFNFFTESFAAAISQFGLIVDPWIIHVMLPVGISFYTFHGLSYVLDIFNRKIKPETNLVNYSLFVGFFPLLVAGPIERATHLLPQIRKARIFNYDHAVDGLKQILWGLFKKVVIADNCGLFANQIFNPEASFSGSTLVLGAVFFSFQIYGDFSGYSDIALGTARLFGIDLLRNFAFPYFSRDIAEFWRRWHISLSSWFKDYVYIPLGGSSSGTFLTIRNTLLVFLLSGFWHGANWTFLFWGLLNAVFFLPLVFFKKNRKYLEFVAQGKSFPGIRELSGMLLTFSLTTFAWIFFRADNLDHAFNFLSGVFSASFFSVPAFAGMNKALLTGLITAIFILIEWSGRSFPYGISRFGFNWKQPFRFGFYYALILVIFLLGGKDQPFIYFQF